VTDEKYASAVNTIKENGEESLIIRNKNEMVEADLLATQEELKVCYIYIYIYICIYIYI
jgi:hypothetical protein